MDHDLGGYKSFTCQGKGTALWGYKPRDDERHQSAVNGNGTHHSNAAQKHCNYAWHSICDKKASECGGYKKECAFLRE